MNALDESSTASSLRRLPLLIRLAPQLVNEFGTFLPSARSASTGVTGLLFGRVETEFVFVQALRSLSSLSDSPEQTETTAREQDWHGMMVSRSKRDPELASLTLLGWFSARSVNSLLAEDLDFHSKNFRKPTDIALIIIRSEEQEFTLELHCRNLAESLSSKDYLWGSVRLPIDETVAAPVEVPMRSKVHDDFYMRAYEFRDAEDGPTAGWRATLSKTKKVLERFKPGKFEAKSENRLPTSALGELEALQIPDTESGTSRSADPALQAGFSTPGASPARITKQQEETAQSPANQGVAPEVTTSLVKESSPAPNLRRLPFSIRLAPQFVNSLSSVLPGNDGAYEKLDGLLFGMVESGFSVLRVGRLFPAGLDTEKPGSFQTFLTQSKKDPQIAGLTPLGWFSVRRFSGLQTEDIAFHGSNFAKANDVILIVRGEPANELVFEAYCRTPDGFFSHDNHRAGSIRISTASPVILPVEVPMEGDVPRDGLIANVQVSEEEKSAGGWKDSITGKTKRAFEFFHSSKGENVEAKDELVKSNRESGKSDSNLLERLESVTPALPFSTRSGGAAAAPARISPDRPETKAPTAQGKENLQLETKNFSPIELLRQELAKQELAKQELAKQELAKQELVKQELVKQELVKQELVKQELVKQELVKQELVKQELVKQELVKQELVKQELVKQELVKQELAKQELAKQELAKQELAKQELAKQELAKQELAKQELATQELARQELLREEPTLSYFGEVPSSRTKYQHAPSEAGPLLPKAAPTQVPSEVSDTEGKPSPEPAFLIRQAFSSDLSRYQPKSIRVLPWRAMAAVFALAAAGTFGFISLKGAGANGRLPGFLQALWPSRGLDLKISTSGDRFQLSWNRAVPAVQNAREAVLEINDGPNHHQILLGGPELANGSVLYLPSTDDVVFRLDVHGTGGQNASGSLRVIGTAKSATLQVSRPEEKPANGSATPIENTAAHAGGRIEASRKAPSAKSLRAKNQELRAANPVPEDVSSKPSAASTPLPPQIAPASKPENEGTQLPANGTSQASTGGTKAVAENSPPSATPASTEASRPSSSNEPPAHSPANLAAPKPGAEEIVQLSEPAKQTAPEQTDLVKNVPAQTPPTVPVRPPQTNPGRGQTLASYHPPVPVKQVLPKVNALPPGVAGTVQEVRVLVRVDETGRVVEARLMEGKNRVGSMLGNAALSAARQWVFEPASLHGKTIASDHTILFQFRH